MYGTSCSTAQEHWWDAVRRSHPTLRVYRGAGIEFLEYVVMRRHCNNFIQGDYRTSVMRDDIPLDACIGTGRQSRSALFPTSHTVETLGADRTPMYSYPETLFSPAFHVLNIVASHIVWYLPSCALRGVTDSVSLMSTVYAKALLLVLLLYAVNASTLCIHSLSGICRLDGCC